MRTLSKSLIVASVCLVLVACSFFAGSEYGHGVGFFSGDRYGYLRGLDKGFLDGYENGSREGFQKGVNVTVDFVKTSTGLTVKVERYQNGSYFFSLDEPYSLALHFELHMWVTHLRNGTVLSQTYHTMTLTNNGTHWLAEKIAHSGGTNTTKWATYIGVSNSSSSVSAGWGSLPSEISDGGLARANGTWVHTTTGYGTWNVSKTFTASATRSTKLYGYYYSSTGDSLISAEQQGVGSQKNLIIGDEEIVTVQGAVS